MGNSSQEDMAASMALKAAKKELRTLMKKRLAGINEESISTQSNAVFQDLKAFKPYQESKRIGVYLAMPTAELQTDAIVRHALENGKQVFVPYLHKSETLGPDKPKSVMEMVQLRDLKDYQSLLRDSWGIPTIDSGSVEKRTNILHGGPSLDLLLMPGVAFDIDSDSCMIRRLGHGKGFYDYFLYRYRERESTRTGGTDLLLYGLALQEQFVAHEGGSSVPVGEHDSLLHGLLIGDGRIVEPPVTNE